MKKNNEDLTIPIEDVQHCEAILEHSRHAGSIPVARSPSENGASVESSVESAKEIASESGHWYLPDGTPFYTTERRSGPQKGEKRAVSLRHDRKLLMSLCAVPSVTTVASVLDKPGLVRYRARNVFDATLRLERRAAIELISNDEFFERVYVESEEHRRAAADRGTAMHGAIERRDASSPHYAAVVAALAQYGIDLNNGASEHSFAHDCGTGCYGGKVDFHYKGCGDLVDTGLVIDFKSKDEITDEQLAGKDKLVYDEHAMQLAAYREGLLMPNARCINVFVGEQDKRVFIYEHTQSDLKRGMRLFKAVLQVWKIKNNYYVRI